MGDFFAGLGHGVLALIGLGSVYDPLGDKRAEVAEATQKIQNTINASSLAISKEQLQLDSDLWQYITTNNDELQETMKYYNEIALDSIDTTNTFLSIIGIIVFLILFFLLFYY